MPVPSRPTAIMVVAASMKVPSCKRLSCWRTASGERSSARVAKVFSWGRFERCTSPGDAALVALAALALDEVIEEGLVGLPALRRFEGQLREDCGHRRRPERPLKTTGTALGGREGVLRLVKERDQMRHATMRAARRCVLAVAT